MDEMQIDRDYASYLLRLQRLQNEEHLVWVVSIQSAVSGERRLFASVDAFTQFLQAEFGAAGTAADVQSNIHITSGE